jgi:O-antigen ligase
VSVEAVRLPRSRVAAVEHSAATELLFLATVFTVTFAKLHWAIAGDVNLSDLLTLGFLLAFAHERLRRADRGFPQTALTALGFFAALLLAYLVGVFNLDTNEATAQFAKGLVKFVLHFLLLAAGLAYVLRRSERFYWRTLGALVAGIAANAAYGVVQLLTARAGVNLDDVLLSRITGGASSINIYGAVGGQEVYRTNALTGDPNHLAIELVVPLLVLVPIYLRLEPEHPWRRRLAVLLGFLLLVELTTLSRSGLLGLGVGVLVLLLPYRHLLRTRALLVPLGVVAAIVAAAIARNWEFFERVIRSRVQTGGGSTSVHFEVYEFIPDVLTAHPLFGLGLNNFSVYYEAVTGKTNWGPHSFYVALLVEGGIVGTILFAFFLRWLFLRARAARAVGRELWRSGDAAAARVRPLAWGLTAALAGTLAANAFYLTMTFYYFYAFAILVAAAPVVFGRRLARA